MTKQSDTDLLEEISKLLQYHESLGIRNYPRTELLERFLSKKKQPSSPQSSFTHRKRPAIIEQTSDKKHFFDPELANKVTLEDVRQELGDCQRCRLHETRTNIVFGQGPDKTKLMIVTDAPGAEDIVFGQGPDKTKLMIVTDAPGAEDDLQEAPVQGAAGDLLDKMLAAIGLSREEVYITTLVKCFPGGESKPRPDEIKTCLPFLFRQIEIVCPAVICTMGMLAAQTLLHSRRSLFQLRGRFYNFNDLCSNDLEEKIMLMPSLHPALLLENIDLKKAEVGRRIEVSRGQGFEGPRVKEFKLPVYCRLIS
jgi:DNA polymerase